MHPFDAEILKKWNQTAEEIAAVARRMIEQGKAIESLLNESFRDTSSITIKMEDILQYGDDPRWWNLDELQDRIDGKEEKEDEDEYDF